MNTTGAVTVTGATPLGSDGMFEMSNPRPLQSRPLLGYLEALEGFQPEKPWACDFWQSAETLGCGSEGVAVAYQEGVGTADVLSSNALHSIYISSLPCPCSVQATIDAIHLHSARAMQGWHQRHK